MDRTRIPNSNKVLLLANMGNRVGVNLTKPFSGQIFWPREVLLNACLSLSRNGRPATAAFQLRGVRTEQVQIPLQNHPRDDPTTGGDHIVPFLNDASKTTCVKE
jgi:hypothetical protein